MKTFIYFLCLVAVLTVGSFFVQEYLDLSILAEVWGIYSRVFGELSPIALVPVFLPLLLALLFIMFKFSMKKNDT